MTHHETTAPSPELVGLTETQPGRDVFHVKYILFDQFTLLLFSLFYS